VGRAKDRALDVCGAHESVVLHCRVSLQCTQSTCIYGCACASAVRREPYIHTAFATLEACHTHGMLFRHSSYSGGRAESSSKRAMWMFATSEVAVWGVVGGRWLMMDENMRLCEPEPELKT
jgi:hypothetical protein